MLHYLTCVLGIVFFFMFRLPEDLTYVEACQGFDLTLALMDFGAGGGCGMYMREPVDLNAIGGCGSS